MPDQPAPRHTPRGALSRRGRMWAPVCCGDARGREFPATADSRSRPVRGGRVWNPTEPTPAKKERRAVGESEKEVRWGGHQSASTPSHPQESGQPSLGCWKVDRWMAESDQRSPLAGTQKRLPPGERRSRLETKAPPAGRRCVSGLEAETARPRRAKTHVAWAWVVRVSASCPGMPRREQFSGQE
jgi:hypothetical protein